jgi:hypothetical protein
MAFVSEPELSADVPDSLAEAQRGERRARDAIVLGELRVVRRIARRFASRPCAPPLRDLEQIGVVGVLIAIDTYQPTLGTWRSRVTSLVLQEIRHAMRSAPMVRPPQSVGGGIPALSLDSEGVESSERWVDRIESRQASVEDRVEAAEIGRSEKRVIALARLVAREAADGQVGSLGMSDVSARPLATSGGREAVK